MSQFEQLKSLYKQFFNLADEVKTLVEKEEYNILSEKLVYKDNLINQLTSFKQTCVFTSEESEEISEIEKQLMEKEKNNIEYLSGLKTDVAAELKKTRKNIKVNSAYSINNSQNSGTLFDDVE